MLVASTSRLPGSFLISRYGQFTTIAASLGLKTTREKLREDFEEVHAHTGGAAKYTTKKRGLAETETA